MTLEEWIKASLGLNDGVSSAIEVNFHIAAMSVEALNNVSPRLDEESLTGAMIGAFVAAQPLSAAAFPGVDKEALQWASYGKNDRGKFGERNSGADFALVVMLPGGRSRLAIFQAKSDQSKSAKKNTLPVGQIKDDGLAMLPGSKELVRVRRNQVKNLTDSAIEVASGGGSKADLKDLYWVHYFCQFQDGVVAVPISCLVDEVRLSISKVRVVDVDVSSKVRVSLHELLRDALVDEPKHWLKINRNVGDSVPRKVDLTSLLELIPIVVGGSEGDRASLNLGDVAPVLLTESLKVEEEPVPPTGFKFGR